MKKISINIFLKFVLVIIVLSSISCSKSHNQQNTINKKVSKSTVLKYEITESMKQESKYKIDAFSEELLEKAYLVTKKSQESDHQIDSFIKIAKAYHEFGQHSQALSVIQEAIRQTKKSGKSKGYYIQSTDFNAIANYYLKYDNQAAAIELLDKALNSAKQILEVEGTEFTLSNIGLSYAKAELHEQALYCGELILYDDLTKVTQLYAFLVHEYIRTEQDERISILIEKAEEIGYKDLLLDEIVESYLYKENFESALELIEIMEMEESKVRNLITIANKYLEIKNKTQALEILERAELINNTISNKASKSWALKSISQLYNQLQQKEKAEKILAQAVGQTKQINDSALQGITSRQMAYQLVSIGKFDEAVDMIDSSNPFIPIHQKIRLLIQIAKKYQESKQPDKAQEVINIAVDKISEITGKELAIPKQESQAFAWRNIAEYALANNQYDLAWEIVEKIESLDNKVSLLTLIADTHIKNKEYDRGKQVLNQATKLLTKVEDKFARALGIAENYIEIGDYKQALIVTKLIYSDAYKADILVDIALKYTKHPKNIDKETFMILEQLN